MSLKTPDYFEIARTVTELLVHGFGYRYVHGAEEGFQQERHSASETLLLTRLQMRPGAPPLTQVLAELSPASASPLATIRRQIHRKLIRAAPPARSNQAFGPGYYFDFDHPENNEFLLVEQFTVPGFTGQQALDLVIFVNGIPLVVAEIAASGPAGLAQGWARLEELQQPAGVPRLFHCVQLLLILQKDAAYYAAPGSPPGAFRPWPDPFPLNLEELRRRLASLPSRLSDFPTPADALLAGLLAPGNLLDLVRGFVFFAPFPLVEHARLTRPHQWQAVQLTVRHLLRSKGAAIRPEDGGIIWHPLGTGRSKTLSALVVKLRHLAAWHRTTLLLITDCEKTRRQLIEACEHHGLPAPLQAGQADLLLHLLHRHPGAVLLANTGCFAANEAPPAVLAEGAAPPPAHATLALLDCPNHDELTEWAGRLRQCLPHACLVGITATPPPRERQQLPPGMRDYLHRYTYREARQDELLVPVYHESPLPERQIQPASPAGSAAGSREVQVALQFDRIAAIAANLIEHFTHNVAANGCKAMLLTHSDQATALYHQALAARNFAPMAVRFAQAPAADSPWRDLYLNIPDHSHALHRLHTETGPLLLITSSLAGLVTPPPELQTIYLDQPAAGAGLLHLVGLTALQHPPFKLNGLLVDYWGVTTNLDEALAVFDPLEVQQVLTPRFTAARFAELQRCHLAVLGCFETHLSRLSTEQWLLALAPAEARQTFGKTFRAFVRLLDSLLPHAQARKLLGEARWFDTIRQQAASFYFDESLAAAQPSPKVREMMARHVEAVPPLSLKEYVSVYDRSFETEVARLTSPLARLARLQHALLHEASVRLARDPAFYGRLLQHTEEILRERMQGRCDDNETQRRLWEQIAILRAGPAAAAGELQLSEDAFAVFGILQTYLAADAAEAAQRREQHRLMATEMLAAIAPWMEIIDWNTKEDVQREMRRQLKQVLRNTRCPRPVMDPLVAALMKLIHARFGKTVAYRHS
ncbi:MAG: type I restriction endonuclease [candidate division KSB1 bacterium]|nr:type I restriction endonuclease [candidate division KSB1 bacterium]MDZ7273102.1 type I restriction endonuclease [candidate division KSB1 bacterium]MDZ7285204.1 type I restriction endonuclease [candidate division KSB1 bacterium]MDZ7298236.1 type I restriction endonuclease [candidate division KSB1 bacterium]MDZ7306738.1 type I restriction endonuclease [candidate division KSB1 bacterium]